MSAWSRSPSTGQQQSLETGRAGVREGAARAQLLVVPVPIGQGWGTRNPGQGREPALTSCVITSLGALGGHWASPSLWGGELRTPPQGLKWGNQGSPRNPVPVVEPWQ